ncbi:MAG: hypothetical protein BJ554DRAFT_8470, partial [Olpidium bornovanus]
LRRRRRRRVAFLLILLLPARRRRPLLVVRWPRLAPAQRPRRLPAAPAGPPGGSRDDRRCGCDRTNRRERKNRASLPGGAPADVRTRVFAAGAGRPWLPGQRPRVPGGPGRRRRRPEAVGVHELAGRRERADIARAIAGNPAAAGRSRRRRDPVATREPRSRLVAGVFPPSEPGVDEPAGAREARDSGGHSETHAAGTAEQVPDHTDPRVGADAAALPAVPPLPRRRGRSAVHHGGQKGPRAPRLPLLDIRSVGRDGGARRGEAEVIRGLRHGTKPVEGQRENRAPAGSRRTRR